MSEASITVTASASTSVPNGSSDAVRDHFRVVDGGDHRAYQGDGAQDSEEHADADDEGEDEQNDRQEGNERCPRVHVRLLWSRHEVTAADPEPQR